MAIVNTRIGNHLIHGQAAAVWGSMTKVNRITVVDDLVARNVVNKGALKIVRSQQCKPFTLTMEKAAKNLKTEKYDQERVFIVTKNPKTIRRLLSHGFQMEAVNIGSMGEKQSTRILKKIVSASQKDIENSLYLADHGVKVTAQMAPTDEALDFVELIRKVEV